MKNRYNEHAQTQNKDPLAADLNYVLVHIVHIAPTPSEPREWDTD